MINKTKVNIILYKVAKWSGWVLVLLMALYFISGYGMTKQVIDPALAAALHNKWLPLPTAVAFLLHTLVYLRFSLQKRLKNERWIDIYIIVLGAIALGLFFWLYIL